MEQKRLSQLANELTDFCFAHGIFNTTYGAKEIKQGIEEQFEDVVFVETIIHHIIIKAKNNRNMDAEKLIYLLSELEQLRLEHEYKAPERTGEKC